MGLDMYLKVENYISSYDWNEEAEKTSFNKLLEGTGLTREDVSADTPSSSVSFTVMYWRKANAIHRWFVENVQGGEDECKPHYVSEEQLQQLVADCKLALNNRDKAAETLPTQSGFFFGSIDYDEWYFKNLEQTVEGIEKVLNNPKFKRWSFKYVSSW